MEMVLQVVMRLHFVELAAFLAEPDPPAVPLRIEVLNLHAWSPSLKS
jgi:hypothetical protein